MHDGHWTYAPEFRAGYIKQHFEYRSLIDGSLVSTGWEMIPREKAA